MSWEDYCLLRSPSHGDMRIVYGGEKDRCESTVVKLLHSFCVSIVSREGVDLIIKTNAADK